MLPYGALKVNASPMGRLLQGKDPVSKKALHHIKEMLKIAEYLP